MVDSELVGNGDEVVDVKTRQTFETMRLPLERPDGSPVGQNWRALPHLREAH